MIYHTISDILAANEASHAQFVSAVSGLTEAQENHHETNDRWTIAEITEHVGIVNEGFLRITHKLLKEAEATPKPPQADLNLGSVIKDENGNPPPPFQAPDRVKPKGGVRVADVLPKMRVTLDGFAAIQTRLEAVDLSEPRFPHPVFGPFSAYQWMILLNEHQDRHREQLEAVKASAGYPQ